VFESLLSSISPYVKSVLKKVPSIFLISAEADSSTSTSSYVTTISGVKKKFSYCSKPVPILNPVLELLKPEEDDRSVDATFKPAFQFAINENNWLGKGIKFQTALNLSTERISGNILLNNPNYKFSNKALKAGLNVASTDRSSSSGFKSSRTGFNIGTSFEQYEDIYFSPSIDILHENIETESSASDRLKKMDGDYFNANFTYGITIDKRNQSWQPTEGYKASITQSLPLIQDSSSIFNTLNISNYHDFSEDWAIVLQQIIQ
jgi:outer membrane protein assembly factor BamA